MPRPSGTRLPKQLVPARVLERIEFRAFGVYDRCDMLIADHEVIHVSPHRTKSIAQPFIKALVFRTRASLRAATVKNGPHRGSDAASHLHDTWHRSGRHRIRIGRTGPHTRHGRMHLGFRMAAAFPLGENLRGVFQSPAHYLARRRGRSDGG